MDSLKGMTALQARKRELLLERELNRQTLRLEVDQIQLQVERFRSGGQWLHGAWRWLAPVTGFFLAWKLKKRTALVAKGSLWMLALRKLLEAWQESKQAQG